MFEIVGVKTRRINAASSSAISAASPRSRTKPGDGDKGLVDTSSNESCTNEKNDVENDDDEMKFILPHHHHSSFSSNNSPSRPLGASTRRRLLSSPITTISTWYMSQMHTHELRTKFITSGILAVVGDICAQTAAHSMIPPVGGTTGEAVYQLDKQRMVAMFIDGLVCTGPLLHYVYEFYEYVLPTGGGGHGHGGNEADNLPTSTNNNDNSSSKRGPMFAALVQVLFDNFIMCIVYIAVLMVFTGILEGRASLIKHELMNDLVPAVKVSWRVSAMGYAPMQFLSFHYLPRKLRVLAVNSLDVVWVTVMSYVTHRNRH
jgi:hypothetical protein